MSQKVYVVYFADIVVAVAATRERAERAANEDDLVADDRFVDGVSRYYTIEEVDLLTDE